MSRDPALRLEDILEAALAVESYVQGYDFQSFQADRRTVDAVTRNLEIIGEATKHLPVEITESHPEIPGVRWPDFATSWPIATFGPKIQSSGMPRPFTTRP